MAQHLVGLSGRDGELEQLETLISGLTLAEPFVATIQGAPGIGKTRLLDEAVNRAQAVGVTIVRAFGRELERDRPFGALVDAFELHADSSDSDRAGIAAMLRPRTATTDADAIAAARFGVVEEIVNLAQRMAATGPLLLAVEDVHWADAATIAAIGRLGRQRSHIGSSLLITVRPGEVSADCDQLLRNLDADGALRLALEELDDDAVVDVVTDLLGAPPGPNLRARVEGAGGNPLYISELVAALADDGQVKVADGLADIDGADLPPSLHLTILRRLGFLSSATLDVLRHASILGQAFSMPELMAVTRKRASDLLRVLEPAMAAKLLVSDGGQLRFRHELIRDAAASDIPAAARSALHLEIAESLASSGIASEATVAKHYERGTDGPHADAANWLWRASEQAAGLSLLDGVELAAASLARTPADDPQRVHRESLHASMAVAAALPEAEAAAVALLEDGVEPPYRWAIELALAEAYSTQRRAIETLQLARADEHRPRAVQARLSGFVGAVLVGNMSLDEVAAQVADVAALHAANPEGQRALGQVLGVDRYDLYEHITPALNDTMLTWMAGRTTEAAVHATACTSALEELHPGQARPEHLAPLLVLSEAGHGQALSPLLELVSRPDASYYVELDVCAGHALWLAGEWDAALAQLESGVERSVSTNRIWVTTLGCALIAWIHVHRGDAAAAKAWLTRAEGSEPGHWFTSQMWPAALLLDSEGQPDEALVRMRSEWDLDGMIGWHVFRRHYAPDLVDLALRSGDVGLARSVAAAIDELSELGDTDPARAVALRCHGLLEESSDLLVRAAETYELAGRPFDAARCREDAAVQLARAGDIAGARVLLDEALIGYDRLSAELDRQRALSRTGQAGVRQPRTPRAPRPTSGWESLTDSESKIVELVADGLTYREIGDRLFISRRTVETHVAHIFTKLSVRSRAQLSAAWFRHAGE